MSASFKNRSVIRKVDQPDAISNLPEHVVDKILICLPLRAAARTSILSRQWRYKWVKLSQLVFDAGFCKNGNLSASKYKLLNRIFQVMLVHNGPVTKFVLSIPWLESCNEIDQILRCLSGKGVEEFTLHIFKGKHYQLHSSLFSLTKMTHMNLQNCAFKPPPSFQGFTKLVQLNLHEVIIHDETLVTLIAQASMLKYLTIVSSSTVNLNIVAPNLKCFKFMAHFDLVQRFNAPLLVNASFLSEVPRNAEKVLASDLVILLNSSPFIQNLTLDYYYLKSLVAGCLFPDLKLNCLKVLKLSAIHFASRNEVACVLLLITSCSNLQNLTLEAFDCVVGLTIQDKQSFIELGNIDLSFCKVCEVEMLNVSGLWSELEFIKLVLGRFLMLERMIIEPHPKVHSARRYNILKEVAQYQRASPQAVIRYEAMFA